MAFGATALKLFQTFFYALAFCCSTIILGLYSYFLATQAQHNVAIPRWQKAVEGISGIGVVYTIFAVVLTCCLGGKIFFAFLAIILDLLLCAGFVAIAILTRSGHSCSGDNVRTPLGDGARDSHTGRDGAIYTPSLATSCHLNQVVFAVAVIGAFIFAFSAIVQLWMGRHHQKQKRYGPSPANNYTKGNGIKFWKRKHGARSAHAAVAKDAEAGAFATTGVAATHNGHNGTHNGHNGTHNGIHNDAHNAALAQDNSYVGNKYEAAPTHGATVPTAGGYHTAPVGTGVNPYGYDNTRTPATNY